MDITQRKRTLMGLVGLLVSTISSADPVDIGAAGTGPLAGMSDFLQDIMDFMAGPWALFALAGGIFLAIGLWIFSPREGGAMGWVFRVIFGGVVILNVGGFLAWLQGFAT